MKHKLEPRLPGEISITSDMQMTPPLWKNGHGTTDWFQKGKGVRQGCILSPCLFMKLKDAYSLEGKLRPT